MAALTVYPTSTNDTLVTTARKLSRQAPASETSVTNKTGKSTGWGVLQSQGNTSGWAAGASEPAFGDTHGFILDETVLEGYGFKAGTWTCKVKVSTTSGTVTSVVHVRVGKRSSSGTFTEIVNCASSSTGITSTAAVVTCTGTTVSDSAVLAAGEKLYVQVELQITANSSTSTTATTSLFMNLSTNESIVSPSLYATSALATAVLNANPKLYWRMDETSGTTAFDNSGNGNDGTDGAGITLNQTSGTADGSPSAAFDDTANAVVTNSSYSPFVVGSSRTFMGWANRSSTADQDTLIGSTSAYPGVCVIRLSSGGQNIAFYAGGSNFVGWVNPWPGLSQWVHWALTYNDSTRAAELFINGVSQGAQTFGAGDGFSGTGGNFRGGAWQTSNDPFGGNMQDFAVFESILSSATIAGIYNAGKLPFTLTASPGSVAITGSPATPPVKHAPTVSPASYSVTGSAALLPVRHAPTVSPGSVVINGVATTLVYTPGTPSGIAYSLVVSPGAMSVTGSNATLPVAHRMGASPSSYAVTGSASTLPVSHKLTASTTSYAITGRAATLPVGRRVSVHPTSYAITGDPVTPPVHRSLVAGVDSMTISGASATLVSSSAPTPPAVIDDIQNPYGGLWMNPY